MVPKLLASVARPFSAYLEITLGEPCRCIYKHTKLSNTARKTESFSIVRLVRKQREMVSPNFNQHIVSGSVRRRYLPTTGLVSNKDSTMH